MKRLKGQPLHRRLTYRWHWYRFKWFYFVQGLAVWLGERLMKKIDQEKDAIDEWWRE